MKASPVTFSKASNLLLQVKLSARRRPAKVFVVDAFLKTFSIFFHNFLENLSKSSNASDK
jgi:hypothetical protein